jgi:hypothetical protein
MSGFFFWGAPAFALAPHPLPLKASQSVASSPARNTALAWFDHSCGLKAPK